MLLGCDIKGKQRETDHDLTVENLLPRDDERQVRLDIARSLINYPKGKITLLSGDSQVD